MNRHQRCADPVRRPVDPSIPSPGVRHPHRAGSLLPLLAATLLLPALSLRPQSVDLPTVPSPEPAPPPPLAGTAPLDLHEDLAARMITGIDDFFLRLTADAAKDRGRLWNRNFASREVYEESVEPNRGHLRRMLGMVEERLPNPRFQFTTYGPQVLTVADTEHFAVYEVRWPVLPGVQGEGLLLQPKGNPVARIVALPDADQTPEMIAGLVEGLPPETQFARRLAEAGCQVLVPTLIDRADTWSGSESLKRFTNQPHREWIYRQAYELGRHIIGYEIHKILAGLDCLSTTGPGSPAAEDAPKLGIAGYGEGGLLAFYTAALDTRLSAALVSGYFGPREDLWQEPIYRNVFGLLNEFGDAELASLVAPRTLIVEYSLVPAVNGPPPARDQRSGAAPGRLRQPSFADVQSEVQRARALFPADRAFAVGLVHDNAAPTLPGSPPALASLLEGLGTTAAIPAASTNRLLDARLAFQPGPRQQRQVSELVRYTQNLVRESDRQRDAFFWDRLPASRRTDWNDLVKDYRRFFWDEIIGRLPPPSSGANPRSRAILEKPKWTGYELMLDVWPNVFTWAYFLLPNDIRPGDRRPVVVCQGGLESLPEDLVSTPGDGGYAVYKGLASRLADRGFIVVIPQNPWRGGNSFRDLERKANPLKKTLYSIIVGQHQRLLQWLSVQTFIDPKRIAFYGVSAGGNAALHVPAVLEDYALSICSADFTQRIWKNSLADAPYSYLYTPEYQMPEFNQGNTFSDAEMAALIAPRPFMVERGQDDPTSPDEWVAVEYARVRRLYTKLAYPERTTIDFFDGGHTINGVGTFQFLYRHLDFTRR